MKLEPIEWISKFKVRNLTRESAPICIQKNAFGNNFPFEDLYVSPRHGILVRGNMIPAKNLVNGKTIFQDFSNDSITYYHIELNKHSAIVANGIFAESYLDVDNRSIFENNIRPSKKSIQNKK